jgi:hypothetical protein
MTDDVSASWDGRPGSLDISKEVLMKNVIDMWEYRRARTGVQRYPARARTYRRGRIGSFVRIVEVSGEIVRLLRE